MLAPNDKLEVAPKAGLTKSASHDVARAMRAPDRLLEVTSVVDSSASTTSTHAI